jgi:hypothetical protein
VRTETSEEGPERRETIDLEALKQGREELLGAAEWTRLAKTLR